MYYKLRNYYKVQRNSGCIRWVDFKKENVLVFLHSLKNNDPRPLAGPWAIILKNGAILGLSPISKTEKIFAKSIHLLPTEV